MKNRSKIKEIMAACSDRTGLATGSRTPKRYLWTDSFAVWRMLKGQVVRKGQVFG